MSSLIASIAQEAEALELSGDERKQYIKERLQEERKREEDREKREIEREGKRREG